MLRNVPTLTHEETSRWVELRTLLRCSNSDHTLSGDQGKAGIDNSAALEGEIR